jgi:hypothetical protein
VAFSSVEAIDRMNSIPPFEDNLGYLPPGVYETTWMEFSQRFGTNRHRLDLLTGIKAACRKLAIAGCRRVVIGGSFVTTKKFPGDFDAYYDDFGLDGAVLDPLFVDEIDRQIDVFRGELRSTFGYDGQLRTDRAGNPRGVVALDPTELIK